MRVKKATSATLTLKNKTGASLVFVLAIAMLLLAIGASVLAAATANRGSYIRQKEHNRVMLLSDSVHRNIQHSLTHDPGDKDLLGYQIIKELYNLILADDDDDIEIELTIAIDGDNLDDVTIKLTFPFRDVQIRESRDHVPGIPIGGGVVEPIPPIPRTPKTATFNVVRMVVEVKIKTTGVAIRDTNRYITTQATYEFRGGVLTDNWPDNATTNPPADADLPMEFTEFGDWELKSYEFVDP